MTESAGSEARSEAAGRGRLAGRVALVTGAASGIGSACARRFAEEGARVVGLDQQDPGDEDWQEACRLSPDSWLQAGDVRSREDLEALAAEVLDRLGRIDVLVNSAGIAGGGPVHALDPEEWDRVLDVNLRGTFLACRAVLPAMMQARRGSLVNIASVEGLEGFEGGSAYNASKGAVVLLTKNLAIDYARLGIRANAVCPGFVDTPLLEGVMGLPGLEALRATVSRAHQLGRFGRPLEIANAALFLASDESSFVTGHSLVVDGGYTAGHRHGIAAMLGLEPEPDEGGPR